ncbi:hypothetical protein [Haloarcula sp. JP-L23]|uniref:DUF7519 family protein n=1 Tax=Haloarcula sp. JP-L23 TaxID=2716717 RepID=UPI00140ED869|nr:hypothetical protein G9465_01575 [Haloarcula sp. JP-L23]
MGGHDPRPRVGGTLLAAALAALVAAVSIDSVATVTLTAGCLGAAAVLAVAARLTDSETRVATLVGNVAAPVGYAAAVGLVCYWWYLGFTDGGVSQPLVGVKLLVLPGLGLFLVVVALARQLSFVEDSEGTGLAGTHRSLVSQSILAVALVPVVGWVAYLPPTLRPTAVFSVWERLIAARAEPVLATTLVPGLVLLVVVLWRLLLVRVEALDLRSPPSAREGRDWGRFGSSLVGLGALVALVAMFVRLGSPNVGIPFLVGPPLLYDGLAVAVLLEAGLLVVTYVLGLIRRTQSDTLANLATEQSGTAVVAVAAFTAPFPSRAASVVGNLVRTVDQLPNELAVRALLLGAVGLALFSLALTLRLLLGVADGFTRSEGHTARVRGAAALLYLGVVLLALRHGRPLLALGGGVGAILIWDVQEHAIVLGQQVGRRLTVTRPEGAHFVGSLLVGGVGAGVGYGVTAATDRSLASAFPSVVLIGVLVLAILLALLWLPRVEAD